MRTLCASTLLGEFFVIGFAGLVAMKQHGLTQGAVWTVCGIAMALCLLLCGMIGRRGGPAAGWVLQAGLVAGGVVVPVMYFLGVAFAALWWAAIHVGRKVDAAKARFAEAHPDPAGTAG
jgi:hypothetical protein